MADVSRKSSEDFREAAACLKTCAAILGLSVAMIACGLFVSPACAQRTPNTRPPSAPGRIVLDIERLRAVSAGRFPNDTPTCQVLVIGGTLGGVAAAEALGQAGISVILTEPTSLLGGQLTAEGLCTPDENAYIEQDPGPGTRNYRALRDFVRTVYAVQPGIKPGRAKNVGQCWNSRITAEPAVWEQGIDAQLTPLFGPRGIRAILTRTQLLDIQRYPGNGNVSYVDVVNLDDGRITRIGAQYVLDATETGDALALSGSPWTIGQEAQTTYHEPDAPSEAHPEWVQSFTDCFLVRWTPNPPQPSIARPDGYDAFKALGEYGLGYDYSLPRGHVEYKMFAFAPGASGPFWTYRRVIAASSFTNNPNFSQDVAMINWQGNDYREESFIGKPVNEQVRILTQAKACAQGFLYWLQTECPRDGGGIGYPEIQMGGDELGGDGFSVFPYLRESRRLLSEYTLTENDMVPGAEEPDQSLGTEHFDSAGIAWYPIDVHPTRGEPPVLAKTLPYEIPLGCFVARSGPVNILPSAIDFGASRLALASARVHPSEWEAGEIAGNLAAFCLTQDATPPQVRNTPALLAAFQAQLEKNGVTTRWREVAGAPAP